VWYFQQEKEVTMDWRNLRDKFTWNTSPYLVSWTFEVISSISDRRRAKPLVKHELDYMNSCTLVPIMACQI
jgi:hypothetical protein